jgi:tRNA (cmo5U34)-methyltransferase
MKSEVYPNAMIEEYSELLKAYPEHYKLREKVAEIFKEYFKDTPRVILDIGCGAGETAQYILENNSNIKVIALDIDERMINRLKENLNKHIESGRLIPICQDIFDYIKTINESFFDGVTSSWTIHNFTKDKRNALLKDIFRILKSKGIFVNMDKYVFDDAYKEQQSFDEVVDKLKLVPNKTVSNIAIQHEEDDRHSDIIMKEQESLIELKQIGFKHINFDIRIGRETVLSCLK